MTSAPSLPTTTDRVVPAPVDQAGSCPVCPHALADHDAISLRFCRATGAGSATNRGCVCPSK